MIPALSGTPPAGVRVLIATRPVDFRRGADSLATTVQSVLAMKQATDNGSRQTIGRALGGAATVLFFAAAIIHPKVADAAHDGRGFHCGGGGFQGGGSRPGSRHPRGGFGGIYAPFWWGYGYPYYNYGDYADHRYYGYDPGASYYGNYPDYGYGSHPTHGRPGTIAPTPPATIPM